MTKWEMVPPQPKTIRVRWWWYALVLAATAATLVIILSACGGDDDVTVDPALGGWITTISPSGQKLECYARPAGLWCLEVGS